ncbi:MAG: hypothetical protein K0V04_05360 [Deltaproteobacteria bacterium]|nr:hypothetical protein [Deltaproteobacteria bacterium]
MTGLDLLLRGGSGVAVAVLLAGCLTANPLDGWDRDEPESAQPLGPEIEGPALVLRIDVDPDAPRLNNLGLPAPMAEGHAGQDPVFQRIGVHHAELVPSAFTPLGAGVIVLDSPHTTKGGHLAVDFDAQPVVTPGGEIVVAALADLMPGTYEYLRIAVSYQEYDVDLEVDVAGQPFEVTGRLASFIESSTYISEFSIAAETIHIDGNRPQGYFAFKAPGMAAVQGQAPAGATTVPNPIDATSPIEVGSCIVTAVFDPPLVIRGDEDEDRVIAATLSTDRSFEWIDGNGDGSWQPLAGEAVVDMGVRGMTLDVR